VVEQRRVELLASALRIRLSAKTEVIAFSKVAATEENLGVFTPFPIPYHGVYAVCDYFWPHIGRLEINQFQNHRDTKRHFNRIVALYKSNKASAESGLAELRSSSTLAAVIFTAHLWIGLRRTFSVLIRISIRDPTSTLLQSHCKLSSPVEKVIY
jgi:hypothetical protein